MSAARQITLADLDVEAVRRRGFREFIRIAWSRVEASRFQPNWHIDAIGEHLEALHRREIHDLVINQPPSTSKSLISSVLFPAWVWTFDAPHRWIMLSYDSDLAMRDARKMRTLVMSEWYRERWPHVEVPMDRSASVAVGLWFNTVGGMRASGTLRGGVTGKHAHTAGIDDPIDTTGAGASSGRELDEVIRFWRETLPTRFADPVSSARFLVMQRLHERDLSAEMIREGATVLCLPMRFESKHPHAWKNDPRRNDGELLQPARFPEEIVAKLETTLGPFQAAAQLQQRPAPAGGGVFKLEWFKRWTELPVGGTWTISVDCTFKATSDGSFVVIQVWYQHDASFYLVDQRRERLSFTETVDALLAMCVTYPKAHSKLVEDKANGPAVVDTLKAKVSGLQLVEPEGGKEARANAVQPLVAAGNVFLPDAERAKYADGRVGAPWVERELLPELLSFPRGANDDQVDAMTQFLNHAAPHNNYLELLKQGMRNVFGGG